MDNALWEPSNKSTSPWKSLFCCYQLPSLPISPHALAQIQDSTPLHTKTLFLVPFSVTFPSLKFTLTEQFGEFVLGSQVLPGIDASTTAHSETPLCLEGIRDVSVLDTAVLDSTSYRNEVHFDPLPPQLLLCSLWGQNLLQVWAGPCAESRGNGWLLRLQPGRLWV